MSANRAREITHILAVAGNIASCIFHRPHPVTKQFLRFSAFVKWLLSLSLLMTLAKTSSHTSPGVFITIIPLYGNIGASIMIILKHCSVNLFAVCYYCHQQFPFPNHPRLQATKCFTTRGTIFCNLWTKLQYHPPSVLTGARGQRGITEAPAFSLKFQLTPDLIADNTTYHAIKVSMTIKHLITIWFCTPFML